MSLDAADATISTTQATVALVVLGIVVIASGIIVIVGRSILSDQNTKGAGSLVRSWIAIALVAGLLVSCAISFELADAGLRNVLFGGLVANVGAAVAFYFSSKAADQARQDILGAAFGSVTVPPLEGKSVADAMTAISKLALVLTVSPDAALGKITKQTPEPGTVAVKGSVVSVTADPS